jgi:acetylornithine deacetylase/succinyl-diaminopimelate desuccinylase-like protein
MPSEPSRAGAIARASAHFASGAFRADLARRVAMRTESETPAHAADLRAYLADEIAPALAPLGFAVTIVDDAAIGPLPFLIAERHEADGLPTALLYGHGDVVAGDAERWRAGLSPWTVTVEGERWYGRGTADSKGQHTILLAGLAAVLAERGRLGCNARLLIEMGEEAGSPGLRRLAERHGAALAADVLIASDGPRLAADRPTLFLGSRGTADIGLTLTLRDGAHHSGNWGGLLANPATLLANAIATLVDGSGRILLTEMRPAAIPAAVREALADLTVGGGPGDPAIDADWGEPGLTPAERVFGWNSLEVLALQAGNAARPVGAVPATARAALQLRFVVGTDADAAVAALRAHLAARGYGGIAVAYDPERTMAATRLDPADPWVGWALASMARTAGKPPALLPNLGGSIPNDVFADTLGLPTLWLPHSYPASSQHAPDEHLLAPLAEEGLRLMAGLFWDLGETGPAVVAARAG